MNIPHVPTRTRHRAGVALAGLLSATLMLSGCGGAATGNEGAVNDDGSVDLSQVTLIVGDQKAGSKSLLEAAGELEDVPYKIEWKEFTSGPPLLEALDAGAIHVGGVGNTPPLFAAAGDSKLRAIQAATYGGAGDAIVVPKDSDIKSVSDLEGKKIAVAEGSSANYNLLAQLDKAGIDYKDVQTQNLQPSDALAAFDAGHVDAWAIWEPYTSQAEHDADARVLATGKGLVNGYVFQVASDEALADKATKAALEDYVGRIAEAQSWTETHKEEWAKAWAEDTGLDVAITLDAARKRDVDLVPINQQVITSEQEMADAFAANGLVPEEFDVEPYFIDDFNSDTTGKG